MKELLDKNEEVEIKNELKQYTFRVECIKYITVTSTNPVFASCDALYEASKNEDYSDVIVDEGAGISVYDPNTDEEYEIDEFYERTNESWGN